MELAIQRGVARICFNRPESANAIDLNFAREFEAAANVCAERRVRVVLLASRGRQFCAGGDLKSFAKEQDLAAHLEEVTNHLHGGIQTFEMMDAPVVVAVQGAAAGAGLGLMSFADVAIAAESATFTLAYTRLGLTPDGSSSWHLPKQIGLRRAADMMLTNRAHSAREALDWGLVSRLVADSQLEREVNEIVEKLAAGPTAAYGEAMRCD